MSVDDRYAEYTYNFPEISEKLNTRGQVMKLREEVREVEQAYEGETMDRFLCEVMDVVHAAETILREYPPEVVDEIHRKTIEKNDKRGYY